MKLLLIFLAASIGCSTGLKPLSNDLLDFINLLSVDDIYEIYLKHLEDEDFLKLITFVLEGDEFKNLLLEAENIKEYLDLINYLDDSGVELYGFINMIHEILEMPPLLRPPGSKNKVTSNPSPLTEFMNDVRTVMSQEKITKMHKQKMDTSEAFKYFASRLYTEELEGIVTRYNENKELQRIQQTMLDNGINTRDVMYFSLEFFGFRPISQISS